MCMSCFPSFQLLLSVLIYVCTCISRDNVYFNHECVVMCVGMCVCYIISAILPALTRRSSDSVHLDHAYVCYTISAILPAITRRPSDSVHLDHACVVCMCVCMINICMYILIHMHIPIYISIVIYFVSRHIVNKQPSKLNK